MWNKFKLWLIGLVVAIGIFYKGTVYLENAGKEKLIAEQNKKALDRIQERKVTVDEVENLDVDATIDRLRKSGWLRKSE